MPQRKTKNRVSQPAIVEVDSFEHVPATRESALLRLEGRYCDTPGRPVLDGTLLVDGRSGVGRHGPLSDPTRDVDLDPAEWLWRVAFSVPAALLRDPRTSFAIEAAPGLVIDLPWPTELDPPGVRARPEIPEPARRGRRPVKSMAAVAVLLAVAFSPPGLPAAAKSDVLRVQRADGTVMFITRNVPRLLRLSDAELRAQAAQVAGGAVEDVSVVETVETEEEDEEAAADPPAAEEPQAEAPATTPAEQPAEEPVNAKDENADGEEPTAMDGEGQERSRSRERHRDRRPRKPRRRHHSGGGGHSHGGGDSSRPSRPRMRNRDGSPARSNPGFVDALPGASRGVPNFVIRKFRVPVFLLPIYQAAGIQYGIRWEILAAINEIETDYGRNLNVSSAGAQGWMQFMPATWKAYGTDGNKDGRADPYNPVDAIFSAARYLKAAGYSQDVRRAIFAYNHADWYVDSVLMRARLISGVPDDLVGSLTGLTEGRFPVAARAQYADDVADSSRQGLGGRNATRIVESDDGRQEIDIFAREGSPVVAVNDSVVKKIGRSEELGNYIVLQDVYGNQYTYAGLGSISELYPVPKDDAEPSERDQRVLGANDPRPRTAASAGRNAPSDSESAASDRVDASHVHIKRRLFAHPERPHASRAGGFEQMLEAQLAGGYETYNAYFAGGLGLNAKNAKLKRLRKGSRIVASTIIGRVGRPEKGKAAHVRFSIRPAGRGAPLIDPKPILDGWKLLESTAIYRASGRNVLRESGAFTIGQLMLLPKPMLQKRILADERIEIYPGGRRDIQTGQIDRRVLATLAFLTESGLRPNVSSLKAGHGYYTSSGNVSHHATGNAVDIAAINGVSILGNQGRGSITEQAVRRLMTLQGTMRPAQIISLMNLGANTVSMGDHHDHIHVGWRPLFGENRRLGQQAEAVLKPGQWEDLIARLRQIRNPVVPRRPSSASLPARRHRGGD